MNADDKRNAFQLMPDSAGPNWRSRAPAELAIELAATHPHLVIQSDAPRSGGMGAVYRALDSANQNHPVAIKVIRRDHTDSRTFNARFEREQKILRSLSHPNIVRYHDSGSTRDGTPFIVMDWLEGRSLAEFTTSDSTRDIKTLLGYFRDACAAVDHAHNVPVERAATPGILHRDIKPANIIVIRERIEGNNIERAVVLDWGIARSLDPSRTAHTFTGEAPGTRGWLAPEVEAGADPDHTADIYALGVTFYQLIMKRLPAGAVIRPSEEGLATEYDTIFLRAAAPDKQERYQSAAELLDAVEEILHIRRTLNPARFRLPVSAGSDSDVRVSKSNPISSEPRTMNFITRFFLFMVFFSVIGVTAGFFLAEGAKYHFEQETRDYENWKIEYPKAVAEYEARLEMQRRGERLSISGFDNNFKPSEPVQPRFLAFEWVVLPKLIGLGGGAALGAIIAVTSMTIGRVWNSRRKFWQRIAIFFRLKQRATGVSLK